MQCALLDKVEVLHTKCPNSWVIHRDTLMANIPLQQDLISTIAESLSQVSEAIKDLTQMLAIAQKLNKDEMFVSPEVVKSANTARALGIDCTCTSWALFEFHSKVNVEKVYKARADVIDVIRRTMRDNNVTIGTDFDSALVAASNESFVASEALTIDLPQFSEPVVKTPVPGNQVQCSAPKRCRLRTRT